MGNNQFKNMQILNYSLAESSKTFVAVYKQKEEHFLGKFSINRQNQISSIKTLDPEYQHAFLQHPPSHLKLDCRKNLVYLLVPNKSHKELTVFDLDKMEALFTIDRLNKAFEQVYLVSPEYNYYFQKKLILFSKTFKKVFTSFQIENSSSVCNDAEKEPIEYIDQKHSIVSLTSKTSS